MSILTKKNNSRDEINSVMAQIATVISDQRGDMVSPEATGMVLGLESLSDVELENARVAFDSVNSQLEQTGLTDIIKRQLGEESDLAGVALESAGITLLAAGDPATYHREFAAPAKGPSANAQVVEATVGEDLSSMFGMESFTTDAFNKYTAMSVVVNALALAQSSFDELFFPTEVVSAGQAGLEVDISIPYAYNRTKRAADGTPWEFDKKSLVNAIEDYRILESAATDIVPNGSNAAGNGAFLVDPNDIANRTVTINGVDIETRPLVFNKEVDLLAVSADPALIGTDGQDETDALEPNVSLGEIYAKVDVDDGAGNVTSAVVKFPVTGLPGALFTRPAEGNANDLTVNFNGVVSLNSAQSDIAATPLSGIGINTHLGVPATDDWNIDLAMTVTGFTNTERANMKVYANSVEITAAYTGADKTPVAKTSAEYTALTGNVTVTLLGYTPKARRINANLRMKGIYIDNSETNKYYFPIAVGAPVNSVKPVSSAGGGATVEGLVRTLRTRSSNLAVSTLLDAEARIDQMMRTGSASTNASSIGALFVKPTYVADTLDVQAAITIRTSAGGGDDLRGLIIDKLTLMADKLALDSSYLSALENFTGADREYDIIIGTDPRIAALIMRSGDSRTLGANRTYVVESSLDLRMRDKIYMSFRRKSQSGVDPLSFGAHLTQPALIHEVQNSSRGNATVSELQALPRESFYVSLPVLARLDIANLDQYYTI